MSKNWAPVQNMQYASFTRFTEIRPNETEGYRAGPTRRPALLAGPAGCDFVRDGRSMPPARDGPHHLPRSGADLLLNVHKTPSLAIRHARKACGTLVDTCLFSNHTRGRSPYVLYPWMPIIL
jgi:hypothetical protein